jgi:hypothetical protein
MFFCGFQLLDSRGEALSSWIPCESLTSFVGVSGGAVNRLLRSLQCFGANKSFGAAAAQADVTCKTKFHIFKEEEVEDLFWAALPSAQRSKDSFESVSGIQLPKSVGVFVFCNGAGECSVEFDQALEDGLDVDLAKAWVCQNLPPFVYVDASSLFGGHVDLAKIAKKLVTEGAVSESLSTDEKTALGLLSLAGLDLQDCLTTHRAPLSAKLVQATMKLNQRLEFPCPEGKLRLDLRIDGSLLDVFVEDLVREEVLHLGAGYPWLRWSITFLSQLAGASQGKQEGSVLLIDSLGSHLYPGKHGELLEYFDKLSSTHSILYTTQFSTMIDLARPGRVLALADDELSRYMSVVAPDDLAAPRLLFQQALGLGSDLKAAARARPALIVSDDFSAELIKSLSGAMRGVGAEFLSDRIHIQSSGNLPRLLTYARFAPSQWSQTVVLLNTNNGGEAIGKKISQLKLPKSVLLGLSIADAAEIEQNEATIEDLFPSEFFLDCVSRAYEIKISTRDLPTEGSDSLGNRVAAATLRLGKLEKKEEQLLPELQRRLGSISSKSDFPAGTFEKSKKLFHALNAALGQVTSPPLKVANKNEARL